MRVRTLSIKHIDFKDLFAFGSPAYVQLTDQERNAGTTENFTGVALNFETIFKPWSKVVYCFKMKDNQTIHNCNIEMRMSNDTKVDTWKLVQQNIDLETTMAEFKERSFKKMPKTEAEILKIQKSMIQTTDEIQKLVAYTTYLGYKRTLELLCKFTTIKLQQQRQHPQFSSGTAADIPRSSSFLR